MFTNNCQIGLPTESRRINPTTNLVVSSISDNVFLNYITNNKEESGNFSQIKIYEENQMIIENNVMCFNHPIFKCVNEKLDKNEIYYVYALLNPNKKGIWFFEDYIFCYEPFYIGKGKGKRMHKHVEEALKTDKNSHKLNTIRKIIREGNYPIVGRLTEFMNEEEAYFIEEDVIRELKRYNCLTNLTDGGDGFKGKHTEETKAIMGSKGEKNGHFGKGYLTKGENNGMFNKSVYERWIELYGVVIADQKLKEMKNKMSEKKKETGGPLKGTNHYKIWLKKFGEKVANQKLEEMSKNQSIAQKNRKIKEVTEKIKFIDINLIIDLYFLNLSINEIIKNYNKIKNTDLYFGLFKKIIQFYKLEENGFIFGAKNKKNLLNKKIFIKENNKEKFYVTK